MIEMADKKEKAHRLSSIIKLKVPRIITNSVILIFAYIVAVIMQPVINSLGTVIPGSSYTSGFLVNFIFIAIMAYFAIKILTDFLSLIEVFSDYFVEKMPYVNEERRSSVKKAIKEIAAALILVVLSGPLTTIIATVPLMGPTLASLLVILTSFAAIFLFFDAGRTLYVELSDFSNKVAALIAGEAEKLEK